MGPHAYFSFLKSKTVFLPWFRNIQLLFRYSINMKATINHNSGHYYVHLITSITLYLIAWFISYLISWHKKEHAVPWSSGGQSKIDIDCQSFKLRFKNWIDAHKWRYACVYRYVLLTSLYLASLQQKIVNDNQITFAYQFTPIILCFPTSVLDNAKECIKIYQQIS